LGFNWLFYFSLFLEICQSEMHPLVMVFEGEKDAYERFIESIAQAPNQ